MDTVFDLLPVSVSEKMVSSKLHVPLSGTCGIFRNKGFSFSDVSKTYDLASMHITWSKKLSDENLFAVAALPAG
jgi:hypothetical protein